MTNRTAPKRKRGQSPLERMTDLTRRLIAVPKSEIPTKPKKRRAKRH